jgi:hypothetical protein
MNHQVHIWVRICRGNRCPSGSFRLVKLTGKSFPRFRAVASKPLEEMYTSFLPF